ncbi:hypothetical protein ACFX2I_018287 [Malus domestica]
MRFSDSEALSAGTGANGLEVDLSGIIDLVACLSIELVNDESEMYEQTAGMSFLAMGRTNTMDPATKASKLFVLEDVGRVLFRAHVESQLKNEIMFKPDLFVAPHPELPLLLLDQMTYVV